MSTYIIEIAAGLTALLWITTLIEEWRQRRDRKRWQIKRPEVFDPNAYWYLQAGIMSIDEVRLEGFQRTWDSLMAGEQHRVLYIPNPPHQADYL